MVFGILESIFVKIQCRLQWEILALLKWDTHSCRLLHFQNVINTPILRLLWDRSWTKKGFCEYRFVALSQFWSLNKCLFQMYRLAQVSKRNLDVLILLPILGWKYSCNTKLHSWQNLCLGFILKIFLKLRKFQPRCSYKISIFF